ncbi:MAG: heavy metal-binding domain-containing protein [Actinomycetota bacterium]|nr:heavy metal-binding domain-containing protein [Actinomycetota bacterium]
MAEEWDGQGLPPAARARLDRAQADGAHSSLLSVGGHTGIESAGFTPVGEVMGCVVAHIGWQGFGGCGYYGPGMGGMSGMGGMGAFGRFGTMAAPPPVGAATGWVGFQPYVDALNAGWDTAMSRMLAECAAIGGDGVVDVRLTETHMENLNREFVVLGTAVRSRGRTRPRRPFTTALDGQDAAKLLHAGWAPASIVIGISVAIRHDDLRTRYEAMAFQSQNVEVSGYTELLTHVRADARHVLAARTSAVGAEGAILTAPVTAHMHKLEVSEGHTDHVAEASVVATAVARFARRPATGAAPLIVLPMRDAPNSLTK